MTKGLEKYEDYDEYLGLTDKEREAVMPHHLEGKLSHYLHIDKEKQQVVTMGRHMETGDVYVQRRRPFSETEKKPHPEGYM